LTEKFPNWLSEEISSVKMKKSETLDLTGYVLSINNKENSIDIQFYQQLPDGRYISTLVLQNKNDLKLIIQAREKTNDAQEYTFKIIVNKASLSDKAKAFLHDNYSTSLDNLYSFGLESFTPIK